MKLASFPSPIRRFAAYGALATLALLSIGCKDDPLTNTARREWKNNAILQIERDLQDKSVITTAVSKANESEIDPGDIGRPWTQGNVLVMRNGDWILCRSICSKENPDIHDLFVGRGSDGQWYYSTFHFCVDRCVLEVDPQPRSLAQFVFGYWLVPFDGKSDSALRETWDGKGDYGPGRILADKDADQHP